MAQLNKSIWNPALYNRVWRVWFMGAPRDAKVAPEEVQKKQMSGSPAEKAAFDGELRDEFESVLQSIGPNTPSPVEALYEQIKTASDSLQQTETAISLMILLDQVPRNIYRTPATLPLVYQHYDPIALALCHKILATRPRLDLHPSVRYSMLYRFWLYMPLMHSENLTDHDMLDKFSEEFIADVDSLGEEEKEGKECKEKLELVKHFGQRHRVILDRFGRYVHRDPYVGRTTTEEERKWLEESGESFGVGAK